MNEEDKGFRVIDRRSSSGAKDDERKPAPPPNGPEFVMKDREEPPVAPDQIDFSTLVFSIATGAFIHLGLAADPVTQKAEKNIPLARQNIDILEMLQKKTKGNLSPEETQLLDSVLTELRFRFVEASK